MIDPAEADRYCDAAVADILRISPGAVLDLPVRFYTNALNAAMEWAEGTLAVPEWRHPT